MNTAKPLLSVKSKILNTYYLCPNESRPKIPVVAKILNTGGDIFRNCLMQTSNLPLSFDPQNNQNNQNNRNTQNN